MVRVALPLVLLSSPALGQTTLAPGAPEGAAVEPAAPAAVELALPGSPEKAEEVFDLVPLQLGANVVQLVPADFGWPSPGFGEGEPVRSVAAGQLTDDSTPDLAVVRDDVLTVSVGTAHYEAFHRVLASGVNDVVFVDVAGDEFAQGYLVSVGSSGLRVHKHTPGTNDFTSVPEGTAQQAHGGLVETGYLDDDAELDLVVVDSDRRTVWMLEAIAPGSWGDPASVQLENGISQVAIVQWDGDPEGEIMTETPAGLYVHDTDGTELFYMRSHGIPGKFTVLRGEADQPAGADRVVYLFHHFDGDRQLLITADPTGWQLPHPVLDGFGYANLASADLDGDGDSEIGLIGPIANQVLLLRNLSELGGNAFSTDEEFAYVLALDDATPGANSGEPAFLDFDLDGDIDVAAVFDGPDELTLFDGDLFEEQFELLVPGEGDFGQTVGLATYYMGSVAHGTSDLVIEVADSFMAGPGNALEVIVWHQSAGPGTFVDPTAVTHCYYAFEEIALNPSATAGYSLVKVAVPKTVQDGHAGTGDFWVDVFWLEVRAIEDDGGSTLAWQGPSIFGSFTSNTPYFGTALLPDPADWLTIAWPYVPVFPVDSPTAAAEGVADLALGLPIASTSLGNNAGGVLRGKKVPRFPPGLIPRPGDECPSPVP